jgi:hypothetical protein
MSQMKMRLKATTGIVSAMVLMLAGVPGGLGQVGGPAGKQASLSWQLIEKTIQPGLPTYQSGRISFDGHILTFIVPVGFVGAGDGIRNRFQMLNQQKATAIILNFIDGKSLDKEAIDKRMESVGEKLNQLEVDPSMVRTSFLGSSVSAFEYVYSASRDNGSALKVLHTMIPVGDIALELIMRSPASQYDSARQELDLFFMSVLTGTTENPPVIPELGSQL